MYILGMRDAWREVVVELCVFIDEVFYMVDLGPWREIYSDVGFSEEGFKVVTVNDFYRDFSNGNTL